MRQLTLGKKIEVIELYLDGLSNNEIVDLLSGAPHWGFKNESWRELIMEAELGDLWLWSLSG